MVQSYDFRSDRPNSALCVTTADDVRVADHTLDELHCFYVSRRCVHETHQSKPGEFWKFSARVGIPHVWHEITHVVRSGAQGNQKRDQENCATPGG